jgi:Ser/Thr protein kinase RdoA (MazF antagonist)
MKSYEEITYQGQVRRMRNLADVALTHYDIEPERMTNLSHGENTCFRVWARPRTQKRDAGLPLYDQYVLRIHINHPTFRDVPPVRSEMQWLQSLRHEAGLDVPEPVPAKNGDLVVRAQAEGVSGERSCVLLRWLPGRFVRGKRWEDTKLWRRMGEFMGRMHAHAERFTPPEGFARNRWDGVTSYYEIRFEEAFHTLEPLIPAADMDVLKRGVERGRAATEGIGEGRDVWGLIHADLHGGNFVVDRGRVCAFDFDDCGFGPYAYDVATMIGWTDMNPLLRKAYLDAYRRIRPFPVEHEAHFVPFCALRMMNLYVWRYGNYTNNTRVHGPADEEAQNAADHLRRLLGNG